MTPPDSYQSQRTTDVAWLPNIPAHWNTARGRHIFRIQKRIAGKLGFQVLSVTQTGIKPKDTTTGEGQLSQDYSKYQFVFAGDFVMNHMDLLTGWVDRSDCNGVTSPDYRVFELIDEESDPDFYRLACQVGYIEKLFYAYGQGVSHLGRWRFPADNFKNFVFPKPPLAEQQAAAIAVDRETSRIDALIEKKTRFIELLKEKRQALITQAVTKGLDPTVQMKDSGVEWIGEVPAHWEVKKIAHLTPVKRGASPRPIDDPRYFDENGEFGWVRIQDVTSCGGTLCSTQQQLSALGSGKSVKMMPGKLFLSIAATVGVPCITEIKCCIHDGFVYFPNLKSPPEWFYRIFEARECFVGLGKMGTQLNLNTETVGGIFVPIPPPRELNCILDELSSRTTAIDKLVERAVQSVDLLKERRSAFITAAVTGQIDLRGDAA